VRAVEARLPVISVICAEMKPTIMMRLIHVAETIAWLSVLVAVKRKASALVSKISEIKREARFVKPLLFWSVFGLIVID